MDGFLKNKQECLIILPAVFKVSYVNAGAKSDRNDQNAEIQEKRDMVVKASVLPLGYAL